MNDLIKLIDNRVKANLENADFVTFAPCIVREILANDYVRVEMVSDKRMFTVLNLSGSLFEVGDEAKLAYRGNISNGSSYIVAAKGRHGVMLNYTTAEEVAEASVIKVHKTDEMIFVSLQVMAASEIQAATEQEIVSVSNIYPYPISGLSGRYFGVVRNRADEAIYDIEASLSDGDADLEGNYHGKLSIILRTRSTAMGEGETFVGQIFCFLPF